MIKLDLIDELRLLESEIRLWLKSDLHKRSIFKCVKRYLHDATPYEREIVDGGYDISYYPRHIYNATVLDLCSTIGDFLDMPTGQTIATYCSGSGIDCQTYLHLLEAFIEESCKKAMLAIIQKNGFILPECYMEEYDDEDDDPSIIYQRAISEERFNDNDLFFVCASLNIIHLEPDLDDLINEISRIPLKSLKT